MGEAVEKPSSPATPAVAEAAETELEACLADDFLLLFEDTFPVFTGDAKQGKKEGVEGQEEEEEELEWLSNIDAFPPLDTSLTFGSTIVPTALDTVEELETEAARVPTKRRSQVPRRPRQVFFNLPFLRGGKSKRVEKQPSVRRCTHCQVDQTPQWRQGPAGPGTLCNACGVRYKSGRLYNEYRPANSPTFSLGKHSNFHKKVLEMREGKQTEGGLVILGKKVARRSRLGGGECGGGEHAGVGSGT